jgi:hypothetical protein
MSVVGTALEKQLPITAIMGTCGRSLWNTKSSQLLCMLFHIDLWFTHSKLVDQDSTGKPISHP